MKPIAVLILGLSALAFAIATAIMAGAVVAFFATRPVGMAVTLVAAFVFPAIVLRALQRIEA